MPNHSRLRSSWGLLLAAWYSVCAVSCADDDDCAPTADPVGDTTSGQESPISQGERGKSDMAVTGQAASAGTDDDDDQGDDDGAADDRGMDESSAGVASDSAEPTAGDDRDDAVPPPADELCSFFDYDAHLIGGFVTDLRFDPSKPSRAFAVSAGRLYESNDSAGTFSPLPVGDANLLALTPDGDGIVFSSRDGIRHFALEGQVDTPLALDGLNPTALLVHPADGAHVYVALSHSTLLHSSDGGYNFDVVNQGLPSLSPLSLVGDPLSPGHVVMAGAELNAESGWSTEGGIWATEDFGNHWQPVYTAGGRTIDLAQCQSDPQVLWGIPLTGGPVRSDDGGRTFEVTEGNLALSTSPSHAGRLPRAVAVGGENCEVVYLGISNEGIYRSGDGGQTFELTTAEGLNLSPRGLHQLAVDPHNADTIMAVLSGGTFRSSDGGATFTPTDLGFPQIQDLVTSSRDPWELLAATWGTSVWRRSEPDQPWEAFSRPSLPDDYAFTAFAPTQEGSYLVGGWLDRYTSTDDGATFTAGESCNFMQFALDPYNEDRVYAATQVCGVFISDDQGQTFSESNLGLEEAATGVGTFVSATAIVADPQTPGLVYLGLVNGGIQTRSADDQPWQLSLDTKNQRVTCLVHDGQDVFACIEDVGIAHTTDGGQSWTYETAGLTTRDVRDLVYDPLSDQLFASTSSGVYQRKGDGAFALVDEHCTLPSGPLAVVGDEQRRLLVIARGDGIVASELTTTED